MAIEFGKGKWYEWPFGGLFSDEEGGIKKISTLSPEQQALMSALAPYLQKYISGGLPSYTGEMVAPASQYETAGLSQLGKYLEGGVSPMTTMGLGQYQKGLAGLSPEEVKQEYMQYEYPGQKSFFEGQILPQIEEQFIPGGTYWGSPKMEAGAGAWETFGEQQLSNIGQRLTSERAAARSLLPYLGEMGQIEGGIPQVQAAMTYGALPRVLQQAELSAKYEEFKRTNPDLAEILNTAMGMLNTTTMAAYNQPYQPSPFMQLLTAAAQGAGKAAGTAAVAGA